MKIILILVVLLSLALLLFLLYQSQKMLRHVQKQQALENKKTDENVNYIPNCSRLKNLRIN